MLYFLPPCRISKLMSVINKNNNNKKPQKQNKTTQYPYNLLLIKLMGEFTTYCLMVKHLCIKYGSKINAMLFSLQVEFQN